MKGLCLLLFVLMIWFVIWFFVYGIRWDLI